MGALGGFVAGALLGGNRRGGLFGGGDGDGSGDAEAMALSQPQANMSIMSALGDLKQSVAVGTAQMETSQALQSAGIVNQLNNVTSSLAARVDSTKETVNAMAMVLSQQLNGLEKTTMENRYELSKDISTDGEKTRALITAQYEATLNRQLAEANAAIIELRNENRFTTRGRETEVNVTQTVNQMQQQQQQQNQFDRLYHVMSDLSQGIRATNQAINIGAGTQTATPTNTSTNTSVR